jgi:hypothetical protein
MLAAGLGQHPGDATFRNPGATRYGGDLIEVR